MPGSPPFRFTQHHPDPRLRRWVLTYWEFAVVEGAPATHHVPPDGCTSVVLVSRDGAPPALWASGPFTTPLAVPANAGQRTRGVRLTPGAAPVLLGVPAADLVNRVTPISQHSALPVVGLTRILAEATVGSLKEALDQLLLDAAPHLPGPDPLAAAALGTLLATDGALPLPELARKLGCSPSTLLRRVKLATGLTPKQHVRIVRFHAAARAMLQDDTTISHSAHRAGYADQSHLHHEVVALTGLTPQGFRERIRATEHEAGSEG